ncbi:MULTISPECIES: alpha/beta fold hydrolase [unclassified Oleiphilus]|uniref:alpha/beta fold hydrolase n=2 Tax=Oleiphilus TaxID=141450 RepID=UPI0007C34FAD|nr:MULTISPECIES: alpha/beta fold hydrolase [unclassified Oleiphilus]KZY44491.1 acyl esterase [Oleiphilus sp. HI0050]KZZ11054.1 acyl esterase [Oleiphilus sp. HI0078]KZZ18981.1 acyl esterase [Oleiphilus sp. HI0081]KZY39940.1 acyl esterase [Oleiphilus sp. HI0043]KZZ36092.1 acyl esterase [Oleiphilus sp. HI0086]
MKLIKTILTASIAASVLVPAAQANNDGYIPALSFVAGLLNQGIFPTSDAYTTNDDIIVEANDGVDLAANVFVPNDLSEPAPAIIFVNSWALNEYEYLTQAGELAEKGYIVFSYSTRGFGTSEGMINTAGPKDIDDFSRVIDYLIENYNVDPERIGSAGVSYGSGISLIGAAHDPRIKAVSAMSAWGSLADSLYGNQTPRLVWGELLTLSGNLLGNLDPIVEQHWSNIKNQNLSEIPAVMEWAGVRSPSNYVDELNTNGTAVYIAKAYGDNLFQPNSLMSMFEQLTGPKHIDLVSGTHASADLLPPVIGAEALPWTSTYQWFDHHLKGDNTPIASAKPITMKVKFEDQYDSFDHFPIEDSSTETFYLHPRSAFDDGDMESYPYWSFFGRDNTINAWAGTLFSTQIPLLSQILEQLEVPILASIPAASDIRSIHWKSSWLSEEMQIRGNPSVSLQIQPKHDEIQLVAYLYDMNALGVGKLITHGAITLPDTNSGEKISVDFDLVTTAYDVPAGHRLVLAVDTKDPQYQSPTGVDYFVDFEYSSNKQSTLKVPTL